MPQENNNLSNFLPCRKQFLIYVAMRQQIKTILFVLFIVFILAIICFRHSSGSQGARPQFTSNKMSPAEIERLALALLKSKHYEKIDDLADSFRISKEASADGTWGLAFVYAGLEPQDSAVDEVWNTRLMEITNWIIAVPDAITPRVAWANVMVDYAWKSRGYGYAAEVSKAAWTLFYTRLAQASQVLDDARILTNKCPQYWSVALTCAMGKQLRKEQFNAIFDEAVKSEPDWSEYYVQRALYYQRRWYGGPGEWPKDLGGLADRLGGEKGDVVYARVVWKLDQLSLFDNPFEDGGASWPRVHAGFEAIERQFPNATDVRQELKHLTDSSVGVESYKLYEKARMEWLAQKYDRAMTDIDKAIELQPTFARAYGCRADIKQAKGNLMGAMADYDNAIKLGTDYYLDFENRGILRQTNGDLSGALADYNETIKLDPTWSDGYAKRATIKRANKDYNGAIADYNEAIKRFRADDYYSARGEIKKLLGDTNGAAADFNLAVKYR